MELVADRGAFGARGQHPGDRPAGRTQPVGEPLDVRDDATRVWVGVDEERHHVDDDQRSAGGCEVGIGEAAAAPLLLAPVLPLFDAPRV
ncbi:hypothetical protein ACGF4C_24365 [Streptomyces sp. NPDC048197]|uniref:hypothetical protein n=1 Tax=Streptomyces sp. NPDC048197 TaxID=3365511 RepID=UPI003719DFF0